LGYSLEAVNTMLQKKRHAGPYWLQRFKRHRSECGKGNADCQLALAMNAYRIKKYIGSYAAVLNGLDAIIFYSIGENSLTYAS
jgi:acetate kinase